MKITKLGHCCLLIVEKGKTLLTDPGTYSTAQDSVTGIDAVLITHEHGDHFHIESLKKVIANNPSARIITNKAVAALLAKENIACELVGHGQSTTVGEVSIAGWGTEHALVYKSLGQVENTGYIIGDRLFYPGDNFTLLEKNIDILALPVAGPWMKISEAIEYALKMKPKSAFPVHDGILRNPGMMSGAFKTILSESGINFMPLGEGQTAEF